MKYLSLFSGIGGFELGIKQAYEDLSKTKGSKQRRYKVRKNSADNEQFSMAKQQPTCIGFSEIDKYAIQTYQKHFPKHKNYGDITKINPSKLPNFDLICGGFPCQAFSIAGKRGGFEDTRGTLFFEIARIIRAKRPRYLFLENVKGLLSHDQGNTFATIISTIDELGYDVQWQVLNSKNFGVPQNRERVFIIGHLRGTSRPQVFPIGENTEASKVGIEIIGTTKGEDNTRIGERDQVYSPNGLMGTLKALDYKQPPQILDFVGAVLSEKKWLENGKEFSRNFPQGNRVYGIEGLSQTLSSQGGGQGAKTGLYAIPVLTPDRLNKRQNGRRFKKNGEPSFTLNTQDRHGVYDGAKVRRLTPTECERLQGFPDGWTQGISDTQRYKCLGNAVTVNVIKEIAKKLL